MVSDKTRYNTSNPGIDFPSLGESQFLKPMDKRYVRQALSMMDCNSFAERDIAVRFLLKRIRDYFQVVGYVGPIISGASSEISYALCGWTVEPHCAPWRKSITACSVSAWSNPAEVFNQVRYMDFETALRLAAWEAELEVPESKEALKRAAWLAMGFIRQNSSKRWHMIRNRNGTRGMLKELDIIIKKIESFSIVEGQYWLGYYTPIAA
ncbi:TPA: hypothetical protein RQN23_000687 [Aeromonas veronii]|nr:hypothetical protein [Aeromonas veronii]